MLWARVNIFGESMPNKASTSTMSSGSTKNKKSARRLNPCAPLGRRCSKRVSAACAVASMSRPNAVTRGGMISRIKRGTVLKIPGYELQIPNKFQCSNACAHAQPTPRIPTMKHVFGILELSIGACLESGIWRPKLTYNIVPRYEK